MEYGTSKVYIFKRTEELVKINKHCFSLTLRNCYIMKDERNIIFKPHDVNFRTKYTQQEEGKLVLEAEQKKAMVIERKKKVSTEKALKITLVV